MWGPSIGGGGARGAVPDSSGDADNGSSAALDSSPGSLPLALMLLTQGEDVDGPVALPVNTYHCPTGLEELKRLA